MIYIVLVNYNGTDDTIECLEALLRLDGPEVRVVVVDNASRDDALGRIAQWADGPPAVVPDNAVWQKLPSARRREPTYAIMSAADAGSAVASQWLTLISSGGNLGFAGGNNIGIRLAMNDPAFTHVWVLNNDTVIEPDALAKLVERGAQDPAIGMTGSTLLYYDAPDTVQAYGASYSPLFGRGSHLGAETNRQTMPSTASVEDRLAYVVGASLLVTRACLEKAGLMDEGYFLYSEEIDWATRAKKHFRLAWARDSRVYHKEGASIGTSQRDRPSDVALHYLTSSSLRFTMRYHPMCTATAVIRHLAIAARYATVRGDKRAAKVVFGAIWSRLTKGEAANKA